MPTVVAGGIAAVQQRGTGGDGALHMREGLRPLRRRHHRPEVGRRVGRVADAQGARVRHERLDERVIPPAVHVDPLRRRAHLPGVEVGGPGGTLRRDLQRLAVDVAADDQRVLAAHLEVEASHAIDRPVGDRRPRGRRAGEGDAVDAGIIDELRANAAVARQQLHGAGRERREERCERERGERRELRGLRDHGIASASAGASFQASSRSG